MADIVRPHLVTACAVCCAVQARLEAFQTALSELIMFKSRVDVALLQATDSAARLAAEAEETEIRYNKARLGERRHRRGVWQA